MRSEVVIRVCVFVATLCILAGGVMNTMGVYSTKDTEKPNPPTVSKVIVDNTKEIEAIRSELAWYKNQTERIFGGKFKPGNLRSTTINLSSYNPVEEQCDKDPLIAADNRLVTPGILALPKHYREDLGLSFGQVVWIPPYGQFVIRDHMNSRKKSGRGDIISFIPEWSKKFGIDNIATMYWVTDKL